MKKLNSLVVFVARNRKLIFKTLKIGLLVVACLFIFLFIFRNPLIRFVAERKINSFNKRYNAELMVGKMEWKLLSQFELQNISLRPLHGDTLLKIKHLQFRLSVWKLLLGRIAFHKFEMENTYLTLIRHDSITNYSFLLGKPKKADTTKKFIPARNYDLRFYRLFEAAFDKIPSTMKIKNFNVSSVVGNYEVSLQVENFSINNRMFKVPVWVREEGYQSRWIVEGRLDAGERIAHFKWYSLGAGKVVIPYLQHKWKAEVAFDTLEFMLTEKRYSNHIFTFENTSSVKGLEILNDRISTEKVFFQHMSLSGIVNVGKNYFELDSATHVIFNQLNFNPYIKLQLQPTRQITLKIHKKEFPAQDLFSSLPRGLFTNLEGIRTSGGLSYNLDFFVDLTQPDSVIFNSALNRHDFHIESFGNTNFTYINSSFPYTAYERGVPVKTFTVGAENPEFRTLDQMPSYLKDAVMLSEDGEFYYHRGFIPDAIRKSIATNIKQKRFARGGSTISMQLVKNVFLTRNKTIVRKVEEALIVWLIENNGLCLKDRMFEVYLNIIEWGPLIYGAQEAAQYYFNKDVGQLTLSEAIYLAAIIPRPKSFKYTFDEFGHLKEYLQGYYKLLSGKMLRREMITQQEHDELVPDVELTGPAKLILLPADSLAPVNDSLRFEINYSGDEF